jgi:hypothetical protein
MRAQLRVGRQIVLSFSCAAALALACGGNGGGGGGGGPGGELQAPTVDLTGEWSAFGELPNSGIVLADASIAQSGNSLAITFGGAAVSGTISGDTATFSATIAPDPIEPAPVSFSVSAASSGDGTLLRGTVQANGSSGPFTAVKKAPPSADLSGTWMIYLRRSGDDHPAMAEVTVSQEGSSLTVTPRDLSLFKPIEGARGVVYGDRVVLYDIEMNNIFHGGGSFPLLLGTIGADEAMSGELDESEGFDPVVSGTWRANKMIVGTVSFGAEAAIPTPQPDPEPGPIPPPPVQLDYRTLTFDGSHFWMVDLGGDVLEFDGQGVLQGTSLNLGPGVDRMVFDGTHFWYIQSDFGGSGLTLTVHERDTSWASVGSPVTPGFLVLNSMLAYDGTALWLQTNDLSDLVRKVDLSGQLQGAIAPPQEPKALAWDGDGLLLGMSEGAETPDRIYVFDPARGDVTAAYDFADTAHRITNLVFDGAALWCIDEENGEIYSLSFDPAR